MRYVDALRKESRSSGITKGLVSCSWTNASTRCPRASCQVTSKALSGLWSIPTRPRNVCHSATASNSSVYAPFRYICHVSGQKSVVAHEEDRDSISRRDEPVDQERDPPSVS